MKIKIIILYILIVSCASSGCNKFEPDYSNGQATALKNGESWKGQGRGTVNNQGIGIGMEFEVYDKNGIPRQSISFRKIPLIQGSYLVFNTSGQSTDSISGCSFVTLSHDVDVIEDRYRVAESEMESKVTIPEYNESERILTGEFKVKFYIDPDRPKANPSNPDTIQFEMGAFVVEIKE